ncbi:HAD-IC family P-type ATPase [Nitriliruptoraceae bacterium ZYF776]|nr:HAD-IC family P-type ATPase [Profundirhabdus halotolerans]
MEDTVAFGPLRTVVGASWAAATLPVRLAADLVDGAVASVTDRDADDGSTDGDPRPGSLRLVGDDGPVDAAAGQGTDGRSDAAPTAAPATASAAETAPDAGGLDLAALLELVGDVVGDGADLVEDVTGRFEDVVEEGTELVEDLFGRHRRVWEDEEHGHAQIEVRGIEDPDATGLRRRLARRIAALDDVRWTEVNALTGRVAVAFSGGHSTLSAVVDLIEGVEEAHGVSGRRVAPWDVEDRSEHPADDEPVHRTVALMAGDVAALGWAAAGRVARVARVPVELAGLVSVVDNNPWLRGKLEQVLGRRATSLLLPLGSAAANGISQGPLGILVDLGLQTTLLGELRARRHVWEQREPELYAVHGEGAIEPPDLAPRPQPLPDGPVETWSRRLSQGSLAGFAGTLLATRDPRRAADALLVGTPKAARLGREGFAAHLGRTLAYRGIVPLDASALRRLDRVDTVVLDGSVLEGDQVEVADVVTPDGAPADPSLHARAERLLDPADPAADRRDGRWRSVPFRRAVEEGVTLPRGTRTRVRELVARGAAPNLLLEGGTVVAIVGVRPELDAGVEVVVDAVRDAGHRLLVAEDRRRGHLTDRLGADGTVPAGGPLGDAVRDLQAEGSVVLVLGHQGHRGLAAADVGIGVLAPGAPPSWGADLLLGRELADAATVVAATVVAREVSDRSARFAAGGSGLGALVSLTGPARTAGPRGLAMVNGAGAAALVSGTWSAVELARRPRPRVPDGIRWHALDVDRAVRQLGTSATDGLSDTEALHRRAARPDASAEVAPSEPFLAELANPLNPVLAAGAGLSAAVGDRTDALLVLALIGLNTAVGGAQRLRADRTVRALLQPQLSEATVRRDGTDTTVREDQLVPGDLLVLQSGDVIPADARLVTADALEVDEASLTGESLPVRKSPEPCPDAEVPDRTCLLHAGTTVTGGRATALVVATGERTEAARSLALAGQPPPSGVEVRLEELTRRLLPGALAAAGTTAGVGVLRRWPMRDVAGTTVSLAIASVPEGLPFVATAGQLAGARRLARRGAVVRNPRTVEALGRIDVLCVDKTGTLTEGRVQLTGVSDGTRVVPLGDDAVTRGVIAAALRASEPWPDDADTGAPDATADPDTVLDDTDVALHLAAQRIGVHAQDEASGWERVTDLPFEATRGVHATLGRREGEQQLVVKGAPEVVLEACLTWKRTDGDDVPLGDAERAGLLAHVEQLAARGHRLLAVADRTASSRPELDEDRLERLRFRGFLVLADPVRATAAEAVRGIGAAGVRTVMVTGDHPGTARAIAEELGIDAADAVLTGTDIDGLDDDQLGQALEHAGVVARVTPAQKLRIVATLQAGGHTVAMTGDGANDAAAIRLADVGVALGDRAAPAARDAADIVVTDDRVETLIAAIAEGRALWGSIREALAVLVGGNLGEIGFTTLASLFSRSAPMHPRQFLLVNLFTDLAPAVAIAVRPPDVSAETLLREGPEASLGAALRRDVAIRGTATALGAGAAWGAARLTGTAKRASTVGLLALVGTQLGQTVAAGGWRRPTTLLTGLGSAVGLAAIVQTPGVSQFFGCRPVGPLGWAQATTAATLATVGSGVASAVVARAEGTAEGAAGAPGPVADPATGVDTEPHLEAVPDPEER